VTLRDVSDPKTLAAARPPVVKAWKFLHVLRVERWRVLVMFRAYYGLGSPQFEFEFRLGRSSRKPMPDYFDYEGDLDA
jgi:hypothetical protein